MNLKIDFEFQVKVELKAETANGDGNEGDESILAGTSRGAGVRGPTVRCHVLFLKFR